MRHPIVVLGLLLACGQAVEPPPTPAFLAVQLTACGQAAKALTDCVDPIAGPRVGAYYAAHVVWRGTRYLGGGESWVYGGPGTYCPNFDATTGRCAVYGTWGPYATDSAEEWIGFNFGTPGVRYTLSFYLLDAPLGAPIRAQWDSAFGPTTGEVPTP